MPCYNSTLNLNVSVVVVSTMKKVCAGVMYLGAVPILPSLPSSCKTIKPALMLLAKPDVLKIMQQAFQFGSVYPETLKLLHVFDF